MRRTWHPLRPGPLSRYDAERLNAALGEIYQQLDIRPVAPLQILQGPAGPILVLDGQAVRNVPAGSTILYPSGSTVIYQDGSTLQLGSGGAGGTGPNVRSGSPVTWDLTGYPVTIKDSTNLSGTPLWIFQVWPEFDFPWIETWAPTYAFPNNTDITFPTFAPVQPLDAGVANPGIVKGIAQPNPIKARRIRIVNRGANPVKILHKGAANAVNNVNFPDGVAKLLKTDDWLELVYNTALNQWDAVASSVPFLGASSKGDLSAFDGTSYQKLAVGADGTVLTADSTQSLGVKWAAASGGPVGNNNYSASLGTTQAVTTAATLLTLTISAGQAGTYDVTADVNGQNSTGATLGVVDTLAWIAHNGTAIASAYMHVAQASLAANSTQYGNASARAVVTVAAGDTLTLVAQANDSVPSATHNIIGGANASTRLVAVRVY